MPLMQWNEAMSVKVSSFDKDHQKLVKLLNELFDGITEGKAKDILDKVLDELVQYTHVHFSREEDAFAHYGYPKLAEHQKEHAVFTGKIEEARKAWKQGQSAILSRELLHYLKDWLIKHIQGTDKQYGDFLNAKGLK